MSSTQDLKSLRHSKPANNSNKSKHKEPRKNGKDSNSWEKSQTLSYCQQATGTLLSTADKLGSLTFMSLIAHPVLT